MLSGKEDNSRSGDMDWFGYTYLPEDDEVWGDNPNGTLTFVLNDSRWGGSPGPGVPKKVVFTSRTEWEAYGYDDQPIEIEDPDSFYNWLTLSDWSTWDEMIDTLAKYGLPFYFVDALALSLSNMEVYLEFNSGDNVWHSIGTSAQLNTAVVDHREIRLRLAQMDILSKMYQSKLKTISN
jgi:hypothetical protein